MPRSKMNKTMMVAAGILIITFFGWLKLIFSINTVEVNRKSIPVKLKVFSTVTDLWQEEERRSCLGLTPGETLSIGILDDVIGRWGTATSSECRELYQKFRAIYSVSRRPGEVIIPDSFRPKVLEWLNDEEELFKEVKLQYITEIFNKYTHESAIFNPIGYKKPCAVNTAGDVRQYVDKLAKDSENDCDFCAYKVLTAEDTFGRIESEHSVTASNTFKYDGYHSLIMLKTHSPIDFTEVQFLDMMDTAMKWFMKVNEVDKNYKYPHIMWDCTPKGSTSMIHPHAHASLSPVRYYGLMEHIHLSAMEYSRNNGGSNYFSDLIQIHSMLGLTTRLGSATAMAYITPKQEYEVMIISQHASTDFFRLLFYTMRAYIEDLRLYAWSLAMFLPKLEPHSSPASDDIPAIVRIISRGPANNPRNDMSAMELFAASNVNVDPFNVIDHVITSVEKRSGKSEEHLE